MAMAKMLKKISRLPFAPIVAGMYALAFAILVMAAPAWILEAIVGQSGVDQVVSAAAPPLGMKARALLALLGAGGVAAFFFVTLKPVEMLMSRPKKAKAATPVTKIVEPSAPDPVVEDEDAFGGRRRRPLLAREELGAPFMSDEALDDAPILPPLADEVEMADDTLDLDQALELDMSQAIVEHAHSPLMVKKSNLTLEPPVEVPDAFDLVEPFEPAHSEVPAAPTIDTPKPFGIPLAADEDVVEPAPEWTQPIVPEMRIPVAPPQVEVRDTGSLQDLVGQLEQGIDRRAAAISATQAAVDSIAAVEALEKAQASNGDTPSNGATPGLGQAQAEVDTALRRALETLDRLAAGAR
jgi:hypothetical protein